MFDKKYFEDIWGTVHRHDYADSLADSLVSKYGKGRFLDIGAGCGILVKALRERGCDAWGMEVSDYALENSCCPDFVRKGDVRDIPFASGFDVIHSNGLWEYVPEQDVKKAWSECKRVGKIQHHNIDTLNDQAEWSKDFITHKSQEWWDNQFYPKVLIGTPTHITKEYSFQQWLDNIKSFTYPNFDILVVDNSPDEELVNRWKDKVNIKHIDTTGMKELATLRMNMSFGLIQREFLAGNYERLATIESDIIPPKDIIETMLELGKDADWTSMSFPNRQHQENHEHGLGCCMFTRKLMEKYKWEDLADYYTSDGGLWLKVRPDSSLKTAEFWHYADIIHLNG